MCEFLQSIYFDRRCAPDDLPPEVEEDDEEEAHMKLLSDGLSGSMGMLSDGAGLAQGFAGTLGGGLSKMGSMALSVGLTARVHVEGLSRPYAGTPGLFGGGLDIEGVRGCFLLLDPVQGALDEHGRVTAENTKLIKDNVVVCKHSDEISVVEQLQFVEKNGGVGLVVILGPEMLWPHFMQGDSDSTIPCCMITTADGQELREIFNFYDILGEPFLDGHMYSTTDVIFAKNGPVERLKRVTAASKHEDNLRCCDSAQEGPHNFIVQDFNTFVDANVAEIQ